jgi:AcrR family transcriptional regulator
VEEKKIEVIRVAIRLFSEKGYNSTSVEKIAKESGMAKGSFYKLFHSKEDLLLQILSLVPKQIENGITKIYSKNYASDHEKLIDFISMFVEIILSNQVHLLMTTIFDLALIQNKEIAEKVERTELKICMWNREFLLDLYGSKVEDYIGDLISLIRGFLFQYMYKCRYRESMVDSKKVALFIAAVLDSVVNGLLERKPKPVFKI